MVGIILFDYFRVKVGNYIDKSKNEKVAIVSFHNILGYYQYGLNLRNDLINYFNKNKTQISKLNYSEDDFLAFCMIESYKIIMNRIERSKQIDSFILHEFTNNKRKSNMKLYLSLRAFIQNKELKQLFNTDIRSYINTYLADYNLKLLKDKIDFARQLNSDFVVASEDSDLTYGIDFSNGNKGMGFDESLAGTFWYYDRKNESFYSADRLTTSMTKPPLQNLYAVNQLNLKYQKINP